jgi:TatD DNase family protein
MLIDTHCHLDYIPFSPRLPEILTSASHCGVDRFIVPGVEPQSWERIISLSREDERIFAAPGVHPMHADRWNAAAEESLQRLVPEIVAVGEIGLDYLDGMPPRELQQAVFRSQLRIALKADLPVIIHCRKAFNDLLRILAEEAGGPVQGVMHAFSGSVEIARECIDRGLMIGIAGPVTWRNAVRPVKVVKEIPLRHLLLETDSPDIPPEPHRGEVNEPAFLVDIVRKVAEIKGVAEEAVANATTENAMFVFRRLKMPCLNLNSRH